MSDELEIVGNDDLEARIVAVILDEASDFERAEIDRLCEEKPELAVFRRRLEMVDGLLGEARNRELGDVSAWQLSGKRREAVLAKLGEKETIVKGPANRWKVSPGLLRMVAVLFVLIAVMGILFSVMMKPLGSTQLAVQEPDLINDSAAEQPVEESVDLQSASASAPASSMAKVITTNTASPVAVPVPSNRLKPNDAAAFGVGKDFGTGWGDDDKAVVSRGLRSGDFSIDGKNIDALPNIPQQQSAFGYSAEAPVRQSQPKDDAVEAAVKALFAGREAYASKDYESAYKLYEKATELAPKTEDAKGLRDEMNAHLADSAIALSQQKRRIGKYREAQGLLEEVVSVDPDRFGGQAINEVFEDPIRTNPSVTGSHLKKVDDVRRLLYEGEASYNLSDFDEATSTFESVLRIDPNNRTARRWQERVKAQTADYYRAAYDQSRSELLAEIDAAWELVIPAEDGDEKGLTAALDDTSLEERLTGLPIENLLRFAAVLPDENDPFITLKNNYLTAKRSLEAKKAEGLDLGHPAMVLLQKEIGGLENEMQASLPRIVEELRSPKKRAKAQEAVTLEPPLDEQDAATKGDSTFSLNISDVSFKLAQAALAKGEWPETVRVEEFVNAFTYDEEALRPSEQVGVTMEQAAHPFFPQRNLLRLSLQTAATGRASGVPLRLTVVLDKSGSMERRDRSSAIEEAFRVLTEQLNPGDQVSLISFSRAPKLLVDSLDGSEGERLLQILRDTPSEGGTNVEEALKLARAKAVENYLPEAQNRIILLTDGIANLGNAVPEELMKLIEETRKEGIAFDACGVGVEGLNDDILEALTRKGDGRYYLLSSSEESGADFARQVAGALRPAAQDVKVQVEWNADRVGKWRLYGFEKHELKKEDFRNDAVDAAEMAAEEEGVAVYHVEVKPDGDGPLGVARVRFRDVASGEMVEREWEIAYQGEATPFQNADSRIRLASAAALTAERLARSAVGERVEWDALLTEVRTLKAQFPKQARVADLEVMIEQAKSIQ